MKNPRERRQAPRFVREFPLRYRSLPVDRSGFSNASVEDLSPSGVRFRCTGDVRVRSSLLFELLIPGAQPVRTFGRAAWVRELPGHDGFEIGGKFEDQSTAVRLAIERHLQHEYLPAGR